MGDSLIKATQIINIILLNKNNRYILDIFQC